MTWKYKVMVPDGKMMSVLASNLLREWCGRCLPETQPSDRLPRVTPRKWEAPRLASQMPVPSWSMTWLVLQSQTGSWGQQLPVLTQRAAVLLSRAGGHTGVCRALRLGERGQAHLLHRYLLSPP